MAVTITKLAVILTARTAKFEKGLTKATAKTNLFGKRMKAIGIAATAAFAAIGVAVAAMAAVATKKLIALTAASFKSIDAQQKFASQLGLTQGALAGLQFAAALAGVGTNTLNLGLQRMTRRVAEAGKGMGEAQTALKDLGLDAKVLAKLAPDEQFLRIADALEGVAGSGEGVRLAFKLFDSEGVTLIRLMSQGRRGIEAAMKEAKRLGLALSDLETKRIEDTNDAFTRLKFAFEGLGNTLAKTVAPALTLLVDQMSAAVVGLQRDIADLAQFIKPIRDFIALFDAINKLKTAFQSPFGGGPSVSGQGGGSANEGVRLLRQILEKEQKLLDTVTLQAASFATFQRDSRHVSYHGGFVASGPLGIQTLLPGGP